jgi:hypothetical protein
MTSPSRTQALSEGTLGVALLHIERGDLAAAQPLLAQAAAAGISAGANASLFHGAPALEFVLRCGGRTDDRVQAAVDRIVVARVAAARRRRESGCLPRLAEFDLIRGLTGLGALLLTRAGSAGLIDDVLGCLVALARPVADDHDELPGWWSLDKAGRQLIPGGHGNNGVAHGIAGPLALLALAARRGVQVEGQADAVEVFMRWLDRFGGSYVVTRSQLASGTATQPLAMRPSWCYGALGIARSMQLAAIAVGDLARRQAAEDEAIAAFTDPARLRLITDVSLCHGWAGLLAVTRAIAADSARPDRFAGPIGELSARLAAGIAGLRRPGFMEGTAGALLALEGTNATGWTRCLLID